MSQPSVIQNEFPVAVHAKPEKLCCGKDRAMQYPNKRRDYFAANAPEMPGWYMMEYLSRNLNGSRLDSDGMSEAKANGTMLDAHVQWCWEFAEKMIKAERVRK